MADTLTTPIVGVLELVVLVVLVGRGKDRNVLLVVNAQISVELHFPTTLIEKLLLRKYQESPYGRPPRYTPNQKLANSSPAIQSASSLMRSGIYHTASLISKLVVS